MDLNARRLLPLFSIGIVQKLTGLSARQIRYYEQHKLITPARSEGKQRLFSFADVERLMEIRQLLDDGLNMAGVKRQLAKAHPADTAKAESPEPSDEQLYRQLQQELLEAPKAANPSMFQGDLSRFYRNTLKRLPNQR